MPRGAFAAFVFAGLVAYVLHFIWTPLAVVAFWVVFLATWVGLARGGTARA
jgi:hypothetical protein